MGLAGRTSQVERGELVLRCTLGIAEFQQHLRVVAVRVDEERFEPGRLLGGDLLVNSNQITGDVDLLKLAVLHDPLVGAVCTPSEVWAMVDEMLEAQAFGRHVWRRLHGPGERIPDGAVQDRAAEAVEAAEGCIEASETRISEERWITPRRPMKVWVSVCTPLTLWSCR